MGASVPQHIAVIMDGNGRWAKARGKARLSGHRAGVDALERVLGYCNDAGVKYLTVYAFSTENWKRSKDEVSGLMKLLSSFVKGKEKMLVKNKVRFRVIGRRSDLSEKLQREIAGLEERTAHFERQLIVALSYGGRAEIVDAAVKFADVVGKGGLPADVHEAERLFASCLYAPDVPDPDLVVRTSGEFRLSNFLLWQCAYAEFHSTPVLWPDFSKADFDAALTAYASRRRRLGGRP
jgi:undecaprenyl diphosphate synthase